MVAAGLRTRFRSDRNQKRGLSLLSDVDGQSTARRGVVMAGGANGEHKAAEL